MTVLVSETYKQIMYLMLWDEFMAVIFLCIRQNLKGVTIPTVKCFSQLFFWYKLLYNPRRKIIKYIF